MKKYVFVGIFLFVTHLIYTQDDPIRIVFDVTSNDAKVHQTTLRHVTNMSKMYPDALFKVVVYGQALDMLLKEKSIVEEEIKTFEDNPNVTFIACEMTLVRKSLDKSALIEGVGSVPDGILEIFLRQRVGWGYIKEAQ